MNSLGGKDCGAAFQRRTSSRKDSRKAWSCSADVQEGVAAEKVVSLENERN